MHLQWLIGPCRAQLHHLVLARRSKPPRRCTKLCEHMEETPAATFPCEAGRNASPQALEILGKPLGVAPRARSLSRGGCNHHTSVIPPDTITRKSQGRVTHGAKALTQVPEVTGWPSHCATKSSSRQRRSSGTIEKPTAG